MRLDRQVLAGVMLALVGSGAIAQAVDVCKPGEGGDQEVFQRKLLRLPEPAAATSVDKQISAPASSTVSPDIVSATDFTRLIAVAVDSGLISQSSGATTLNLNAFAFIAALQPRVVQEQEQYERFTTLRRFSGSITLGGKGDALDQDGDGVADDPRTADKSTEIINWEVRYRLYGSRDRRDRANYSQFHEALKKMNAAQSAKLANLSIAYGSKHPDQATAKYFCRPDVERFVADPANRAKVDDFIAADKNLKETFDDIAARIDNSLLVTAVIGGTERKSEVFGPDKRAYGVRASYALNDTTFDANLDYNKVKSFRGAEDQSSTKFGLSYNATYLKDLLGYKDQGITLTLAAAYEKYRDVPDVAHDRIAKANIKLTYPISETISLPLSITYANHADLLDGEKEVRGNVGFTYDLSPLFEQPL